MDFSERFWEIDSLRGIAIILMVISNFATDLAYFSIADLSSGFWWLFARGTASIFLFLVGISLAISYGKRGDDFKHYFKRGAKIFSWGLAITAVTWLFLKGDLILFGVLHLIGVSIIFAYPFLKRRYNSFIYGVSAILVGLYLPNISVSAKWLLPLGLTPANYFYIDYFPIFPWIGVILIGLFFGNLLYHNHKRKINIPDYSQKTKLLQFLGRNSLLIYLIHQPILVGLLYFAGLLIP